MVLCNAIHNGKVPFADEASAKEHVRKTNERERDLVAAHRAGYTKRGDKALRTIHAYRCNGCGLWYVATDKAGIVEHTQELQRTIERHNKSGADRRRVLAAAKFNTPRFAQ